MTPTHTRGIRATPCAPASCRDQGGLRLEGARDDQQAARVLVEPMDDAGARHCGKRRDPCPARRFAGCDAGLPAPGCTTNPAGLSTTRTSRSSCTTLSAIASGPMRRSAPARLSCEPAPATPRAPHPGACTGSRPTEHLARLDPALDARARMLRAAAARARCPAAARPRLAGFRARRLGTLRS